jgi:hypothetical protein
MGIQPIPTCLGIKGLVVVVVINGDSVMAVGAMATPGHKEAASVIAPDTHRIHNCKLAVARL